MTMYPMSLYESKDGRYSPPSEEDVLALTFPEASRVSAPKVWLGSNG